MATPTTKKRLEDSLVWLVFNQPLLSEFVDFIKWEEVENGKMLCDTMGVRMSHNNIIIAYVKDFVDSLKDDELRFILCHELYHVIMAHPFSRLHEHVVDNIACDMEINQNPYLNMPQTLTTTCVTYGNFNLPCSLAREQYYGELMKRANKAGKKKGANGCVTWGDLQGKSGEGKSAGGKNIGDAQGKNGSMDDHGGWGDTSSDVQEVWRERIQELVEAAAAKGNVPGHLVEKIRARWKKHRDLAKLLRRIVGKEISSSIQEMSYWRKKNKRFPRYSGTRDAYSPKFVIAIDTSGSMSSEQLEEAYSLVRWIQRQGYVGKLLQCDAEVAEVADIQKVRREIGVKGRGGTSSVPVFDWVEKHKFNPDMLLFFSDMYTDYPGKKPPYKVTWINVGGDKDCKVPFGRVINA